MNKQIADMIRDLQKIRSKKKELEQQDKALTEQLKIAMQAEAGSMNCEYICGQIKAVINEVSKQIVDTDKLKHEFPEVHLRVLKSSKYTTLTLKVK